MKKQKKYYLVSLILTALALPISWAGATVTLQFNNNPNNVVGGSPETIQAAPGATVVISLQLVSTTETSIGLDYWLAQFSGPGSGVFSLTARDFMGSDFNRPIWGDALVINPVDNFSNTQTSGIGHPDGIADNLLAPRNGPDLGARVTGFPNPPGAHQVVTFTLTILLGAVPGLYQIGTFDYPGFLGG